MTLGKIEDSRDEYNFHVIAERVTRLTRSIQKQVYLETDSPLKGSKDSPARTQVAGKYVKQITEKYTPKFVTPKSSIAQKRLVFQSGTFEPVTIAAATGGDTNKNLNLAHTPSLTEAIENQAFRQVFR